MMGMLDSIVEEKVAKQATLPGYKFSAVANEDVTKMSYLVKGVINRGDIAVVFGGSGTMKSFVTSDLSYHLSQGMDWRGHRVRQAGVMIVVAEGQAGYKKRIKALQMHYSNTAAPIWVVPEPVALDTDCDVLRAWVGMAESELGQEIGMVVLDTFSLMLGSGDESSNRDVGISLNNLRKAAEGRAVVLVHHVGHGDNARERGAYQIRGNADVRIMVERSNGGLGNLVSLKCLKSKDDELFKPIHLSFQTVELGVDEDGDAITSLVMTDALEIDVEALVRKQAKKSNKAETGLLNAIVGLLAKKGVCHESELREIAYQSDWLTASDKQDAKQKAFNRAIGSLLMTQVSRDELNRFRIIGDEGAVDEI